MSQKIKVALRHPMIAALLAISALQYFAVQLLVASRWSPAYSFNRNTISDLGNTVCGIHSARFVCSPAHSWMNASFIALGLTMALGSLLAYYIFPRNKGSALGFGAFALGGVGAIIVGLFPENSIPLFHGIGALLPFLIGNIGIVLLGSSLRLPKVLRVYTLLSGVIALIALACYASNHWLGLGEGGIERFVAYPQTVWWIVLGFYMQKHGNKDIS